MWHQFDNAQACANALVTDIRFLLEKTLIEKNRAVLAVSGGRSPILLFQTLSQQDIEWEKIHIILVDERYVEPDHEDSNELLVRTHLLQNHAARAQFSGLAYQTDSLQDDVKQANKQLPDADIIVLGMGDDGHTASLFAYAPQLKQALDTDVTDAPRYTQISPPDAPHERITMTMAALQRADCLILEIAGVTRRHMVERASLRVSSDSPTSYLLAKNWIGAPLQIYWHP